MISKQKSQSNQDQGIDLENFYEIGNLIFYEGSLQALPIRLKILFDRLLSQIVTEDALKLLADFGWSLHDYARGYIIMVH